MGNLLPDQHALLTLTLASGLGPTLIGRAIETLGSPQAVVDASLNELKAIDGIGGHRATGIRRSLDELADGRRLAAELEAVEQAGASVLAITDADYPALLRHIPDPPPVLFVRGRLRKEDGLGLAVVGSRRCTAYGREQAHRLSAAAAEAGLTVVSGGARGIDGASHTAALRAGGRTVAVLGSGLAKPYPPEHADLFDQISSDDGDHGAVVSELPMNTAPAGENFPRRNRIISGLSLGVLVIEAANRSGALITARLAAEEHHREVMAVPGRIDSIASAGCHRIIREGWANLVTSGAEILQCLGEAGQLLQAALDEHQKRAAGASSAVADDTDDDAPSLPFAESGSGAGAGGAATAAAPASVAAMNLTPSQRQLIEQLSQPHHLDELPAATGLAIHVIQADLTILEIRGLVAREGNRFTRRR